MQGAITWFRERRAQKTREAYVAELEDRWRKFVWDWHVPLQIESIRARRPLSQLIEAEKAKADSGQDVDIAALQTAFMALWEAMNAFDDRIGDAFRDWFASDDATEWKDEIAAAGVVDEFVDLAMKIILRASQTTINVSIIKARDIIEDDELFAMVFEQSERN